MALVAGFFSTLYQLFRYISFASLRSTFVLYCVNIFACFNNFNLIKFHDYTSHEKFHIYPSGFYQNSKRHRPISSFIVKALLIPHFLIPADESGSFQRPNFIVDT